MAEQRGEVLDPYDIPLRAISLGSLIKLGALVIASIWVPLGLFFAVMALIGVIPVRINGVPHFGISGMIGGLVLGAMFIAIGSGLFALGAVLARKIRWTAQRRIRIVRYDDATEAGW